MWRACVGVFQNEGDTGVFHFGLVGCWPAGFAGVLVKGILWGSDGDPGGSDAIIGDPAFWEV